MSKGQHTAKDIAEIRRAQTDRCAICRVRLNGGGDVDHIVSIINGGSNLPSNLQLLCGTCNRSKGCKDPIDYMRERGFLI